MFERLQIPTPFQVGDVNAYLAGRTLIDPGPDSEDAWDRLTDELADRGRSPGDVEQVLITHPHPDHFGLAGRFRAAGARVVASPAAAEIVRDFDGRLDAEQSFFVPFLQRHGMDASTAETVTELPEVFLPYAPDCEVDEEPTDGDSLAVADERLDVRSAEGHAPGELLFVVDGPAGRTAVVGDHVLPEITPNPLLQPPAAGGERPRLLPAFNRSLDRLAEADFDRILPGHGGSIGDPTGRIETIRAEHEDRTENVADIVDERVTAVDVMRGLFGDLPATELFPGMSEAIGHLDVLEGRDRVTRIEENGTVVYEPAE